MKTEFSFDELLRLPSTMVSLGLKWADVAGVSIDVKRDDLIHPLISGNKWRKLKYNISECLQNKCDTIITFGGAFSNHLVAVATLGHHINIKTVGIIRGYKIDEDNPTIKIIRSMGMELHLVKPSAYKLKVESVVVQDIISTFSNHFLIPEGGTNENAIRGVSELWGEVVDDSYSHVVMGLGTAGTLAGIVNGAPEKTAVIAVSPFKEEVSQLEGFQFIESNANYKIMPSAVVTRFGAYQQEIVDYINAFYSDNKIILDPIYTAKAMMTMESMCNAGYFPKGSKILFIHTGGLQGILGYNYLHRSKMKSAIVIPSELEILHSYA